MEDAKLAILTDAKNEYSHQLVNVLKSSIHSGLKFLYDEGKKKCIQENRFNEVLSEFQEFLSQIRLWSQDMIENEYKRIEDESGCDFIKELITAVFMSHTQILQSIRTGEQSKQKSNQLDIPKPEHFIHKCYINAGREFYKNPFFFYDGPEISPIEKQRNIPQSELIIANSISETIRQLLPIRKILKTYLQENYNPEQYEEEQQNILRNIVKKEISNYNTNKTSSDTSIRNLIEEEFKNPITSTNSTVSSISNPNNNNININGLDVDETKKKVSEFLEVPAVPSIPLTENNTNENNTNENNTNENNTNEITINQPTTNETISEINIIDLTSNTNNNTNNNNTNNNDDIFETIPELSLDEIEMIIKKQEEDDEQDLLKEQNEQNEKKEIINELPNLNLNIDFEEVKIETETQTEKEIKSNEIKNVVVDNEPVLTKKAKQELKNAEIIVEKKETSPSLVHPASLKPQEVKEQVKEQVKEPVKEQIKEPVKEQIEVKEVIKPIPVAESKNNEKDELKFYDPSLEFDEEINLMDDIIFEQPKKTNNISIPLTSKKYTFF